MRAAVTIDVDSLRFYAQIHGLSCARNRDARDDPVYTTALPRFAALLREAGIRATVFAVGQDAARHPEAFAFVASTGSELASHSFRHDYRLSQRTPPEIETDLARAEEALHPLCPAPHDGASRGVRGFRAPGYNVSPALLAVVVRRGYRYDSSLLPAPLYWVARAATLARYTVVRRPSASLRGRLAAFAGPLGPYRTRPETPWAPDPRGALLELPMAVSPRTRLPIIGTSWTLFPSLLRRRLLDDALARLPLFNFEMHAIDLLGPSDPGIPKALIDAQPDLRVTVDEKMALFSELFSTLARSGEVRTLAEWSSGWNDPRFSEVTALGSVQQQLHHDIQ